VEAHTPLITQPIFLVGAERSGTTVLRLMLDHHPQLAWCNEFEYVVDRITASNGWPELEEYYKWLETHRIFQATGFTIDRSLNYPQLVNSFLCQKREARGKSLVGATVHRHFDQLLKIWPDARFIHLIRDGRDVARSCIPMGWAGNVWTGAERWLKAESLWTQLCQKLPAEQQIEITYEDLISNPINNLTRLCEFIGIPFDLAMLSYPQKTSYDFPNPNLICQWKSKMSKREIQLVESRISTMLLERGYQLSGLPLLTITSTMERRLNRQDWWFRVWFRVQKFGLLLFLSDYFSRKFGLIHWQKRIQLQLNEIVKAHLK
jgi:hypothetical protein